MNNWGLKKGFNTDSGMLYTIQGLSSVKGNTPMFPTSKVLLPKYENKYNMEKALEYMRNGKRQKRTGSATLRIRSPMVLQGGEISNANLNNI